MVAETRENMAQMFDTMADTARASMEAGRRLQESWFEAIGGPNKGEQGFEGFFVQGERMTREFMPFMNKNMQMMAEFANSNFQAGMDTFKTFCEATTKGNEGDVYRRTRDMWDAMFGTFRTGFNAMNKAGIKTLENWANFCQTACAECSPSKMAPKTGK
jgi:hypothetical protein